MSTPVLAVKGLTVAFRRASAWQTVVNDVGFEVGPRETVALIGESGSGKSVTALSILRLLPPRTSRTTGAIHLQGDDLRALSDTAMEQVRGRRVGMVFQEPMSSLNPVLTIGRQIAETLRQHRGFDSKAARAESVRLLDRARIPDARRRVGDYPHQLSGGMLQRVMIAMALACRPTLLIADEPTTALDVTIQAQILELIKELQAEDGLSVLFITHDMGVVAEIADRAVVMLRSRVVETADTASLFAHPRDPYTTTLLAAVPHFGGADAPTRQGDGSPSPQSASAPVLDVRHLVTRFNVRTGVLGTVTARVHAVENVSFQVARGETLGLVGESGCGKSTTGRSILRLVAPTSGTILVDGQDVLALPRKPLRAFRQRMQMIFQDPFSSLNPRQRIGVSVAEPMLAHGRQTRREARERTADLLTRVGLSPDMASRFPHEFSGGQRQRVAIARALALDPALIVADEAVSALDVSIKAQVVDLMLELQQSLGLSYLFVSHDMAVVERACHSVAVMYLGEIVEIGPRAAIFGDPRHPYTKRLLAAVPVADPARRHQRRAVSNREIGSPIHPLGYVPPTRQYDEVSSAHVVQRWGAEWA